MTIPTNNVSFSQIQSEWGGSDPISLGEYYINAGIIPANYYTADKIPPLGTDIQVSDFENTSSEFVGSQITPFFWNNRASLIRGLGGNNAAVWLGDSYTVGGPAQRYVGTQGASWAFANSTLTQYSKTATMVSWAVGSSPTIYAQTSNPLANVLYGPSNLGPASLHVSIIPNFVDLITSNYIAWSRSGGNSGSWAGCFILPGAWQVKVDKLGVTAGDILAPGEISIIFRPSAGDGPGHVPGSGISTSIAWTSWWYNSYGFQMNVNTTNANLFQGTSLDTGYRFVKFYKP